MVTQKHIAQELGISQSAVACAFNTTLHKHVTLDMRRQILHTAEQLGYVPNHAARRMARTRSASTEASFDQIGLIYFDSIDLNQDPTILDIMSGAERELAKLNASLNFVRVSGPSDWDRVERLMRAGRVDGWLLYGWIDDQVMSRFQAHKLPYVIVGDHHCTQPVRNVNIDHAAVGRLVVQYLASFNHRRIGFVHCGEKHAYVRQTLAGFRAALKEFDLDDDERLIVNYSQLQWNFQRPMEQNAKLVLEWIRNVRPTALFGPGSELAAMAYPVLQAAAIAVPKNLSLISYEMARHSSATHNFTRIELPLDEVGYTGALLLQQVAAQPNLEFKDLKIAPVLVQGRSVAPPGDQQRNSEHG